MPRTYSLMTLIKHTLNNHFVPKTYTVFERHEFSQMSKQSDENNEQYVCRLRTKGNIHKRKSPKKRSVTTAVLVVLNNKPRKNIQEVPLQDFYLSLQIIQNWKTNWFMSFVIYGQL